MSQNNWEICGDPLMEGPVPPFLWQSPMLLLQNILLPKHADVVLLVVVIVVLQLLPPQGFLLYHPVIMLLAFYPLSKARIVCVKLHRRFLVIYFYFDNEKAKDFRSLLKCVFVVQLIFQCRLYEVKINGTFFPFLFGVCWYFFNFFKINCYPYRNQNIIQDSVNPLN